MKRLAPLLLFLLLAACAVQAAQRTLKVRARYLNIPVSDRTERGRLSFHALGVDDLTVLVRLAEGEPDYWVFKDLTPYRGQTLTLTYEGSDAALGRLFVADTIMGQATMYREPQRPQFHFTTRRGWVNDPNGLIYHDGQYHLFYQHNPYERDWQNMHWGHATSPDLLHWDELDDALFPDSLGMMFSGSAVFDRENTSGLGSKRHPPLVFAYTNDGAFETQCIAYSTDGGFTLHKYRGGQPVIDSYARWQSHDLRDPRLFWYAPGQHWVMALYELDGISIYTSTNLLNWTWQSHTPGFFECPDLFELPVDGRPGETRWVMSGASGTYMVGRFDGRTFTPIGGKYCYTSGTIYAAQTITDAPDGRRIQIGWGRVTHPGMPFRGMMLLPTELSLRQTADGLRLASQPVREVASLLRPVLDVPQALSARQAAESLQPHALSDGLHLRATLHFAHAVGGALELDGQRIVDYDLNHNLLGGRFYSSQDPTTMNLDVDIYIDRTSVEVFVDGGLYSYSMERRPNETRSGFRFTRDDITVSRLHVDTVDSVWR